MSSINKENTSAYMIYAEKCDKPYEMACVSKRKRKILNVSFITIYFLIKILLHEKKNTTHTHTKYNKHTKKNKIYMHM